MCNWSVCRVFVCFSRSSTISISYSYKRAHTLKILLTKRTNTTVECFIDCDRNDECNKHIEKKNHEQNESNDRRIKERNTLSSGFFIYWLRIVLIFILLLIFVLALIGSCNSIWIVHFDNDRQQKKNSNGKQRIRNGKDTVQIHNDSEQNQVLEVSGSVLSWQRQKIAKKVETSTKRIKPKCKRNVCDCEWFEPIKSSHTASIVTVQFQFVRPVQIMPSVYRHWFNVVQVQLWNHLKCMIVHSNKQ